MTASRKYPNLMTLLTPDASEVKVNQLAILLGDEFWSSKVLDQELEDTTGGLLPQVMALSIQLLLADKRSANAFATVFNSIDDSGMYRVAELVAELVDGFLEHRDRVVLDETVRNQVTVADMEDFGIAGIWVWSS
jgi:hypothetical protein